MKKDLTAYGLDLATLVAGFAPTTAPMLSPNSANLESAPEFLALLNNFEQAYLHARAAIGQSYISALVPYQKDQVLDVDTSWIGRRRIYYKGATRFLVRWIKPYYWGREDGKLTGLFINLYGCYLSESGEILLPEHHVGMPLQPGDWQPEQISLNTSGGTTILGVSANQMHKFEQLLAAGKEADRV
jgi:hypothetical protein